MELRSGPVGQAGLRGILGRVGFFLSVVVVVSPAILVFLWMLSLAFKTDIDNIAYPPVFIPNPPTLDNFFSVFENSPFARYTINSIVVTGSATLLALLVGVPAGYGIAKARAHKLGVLVLSPISSSPCRSSPGS